MDPISDERDLDRLRRVGTAWAIVESWSARGLFDALADGAPRPLDALPGDARALAITAPVLAHLGLLTRMPSPSGDRWALSPTGRRLAAEGALAHMGGRLRDVAQLPLLLAEGGPVPGPDGVRRGTAVGVRDEDSADARRFMNDLYRRSGVAADETARVVSARLGEAARGGRALDLGGGHGRYAEALQAAGMVATVMDRPVCVALARERHGESLRCVEGDFLAPDFAAGDEIEVYDAVLLSNIVHGLSEADLDHLLPRLRRLVRPGGLLVLKDMFLDDAGSSPELAVLFGVTMLLYTAGGRSYAVGELRDRLRAAGFGAVEQVALTDQGFSLILAS